MNNPGAWIIGGTTLIGIGVGFFLLPTSALFFVASILTGIGLGLVIAAFMSRSEQRKADAASKDYQSQT